MFLSHDESFFLVFIVEIEFYVDKSETVSFWFEYLIFQVNKSV